MQRAHTVYLKDYSPPPFLVEHIGLHFDLHEDRAEVRARLQVRGNPAAKRAGILRLDGHHMDLLGVSLDGRALAAGEYELDAEGLSIPAVPEAFTLEITTRTRPQDNTALMGLYRSSTGFFTQCEAEGFRRITYFPDRPDVMARYTVTIEAERERYPVLLSNGNLVGTEDLADGRHSATWEDPFPKPSYLFALVAGRFDCLEDHYDTRSGRRAALRIYVEPGNLDKCRHAMDALKRAMRWDEEVFGLELDLDCYHIVAVGDFNMGAMENKGLNIFNTKYVLARPDTATDRDFQNIEAVVAHEYFHNWTGNRVTCRDWFQLSLKEGLTVFRDQEFISDTWSRPVKRIEDVRTLRNRQFAEDAGPMAHPVRPDAYEEISNFYTATVYEKGAEVVRMMHTLLGRDGFRRGMDRYFQRHDGQAVTCDDFVAAMEDANGADLQQFRRWYSQAGTPLVRVSDEYDPQAQRYTLSLEQSCRPTPGQPEKQPFHLPFAVGLVGPSGEDLPLRLEGEARADGGTRVLHLTEAQQRFSFVDVPVRPVPSLLRGFSAPVQVEYGYSDQALAFLMAHDSDPFNRWEAAQRLALKLLLQLVEAVRAGHELELDSGFVEACGRLLDDASAEPAFRAEALTLPAESYIAEQMAVADPHAIHAARRFLRAELARRLQGALLEAYHQHATPGPYRPDPASAGRRALRNLALGYLMELETPEARALCMRQFETAGNMTDALAALGALANCECPERAPALESFYQRWQDEALVVDKWFSLQATSRLPGTLEAVRALTAHPAFNLKNPNKVYALVGSFANGNPVRFHAADGAGYRFVADQVIALDPMNPQVAARLARSLERWRKYDGGRQRLMRGELERIGAAPGLSRDVREVVEKSLA